MSVLVKANIDPKIAEHAALATGIHGVGSLNIAGFHSAGQAVSKIIWTPTQPSFLNDDNRTVDLAWTDIDLSSAIGANAKAALLQLRLSTDVIGTGSASELRVRKNGITPTHSPRYRVWKEEVVNLSTGYAFVLVDVDVNGVIEYMIDVGTGWQIDTNINVMGYIE